MEQVKANVIEVTTDDVSTKLTLIIGDVVAELGIFKQKYDADTKLWLDDSETAGRYEEQLEKLGVATADELQGKDIFVYYNQGKATFYKPKNKFGLDQVDELLTGTVTGFEDDEDFKRYVLTVEIDGVAYSINIAYGKYIEALEKSLLDEAKKTRQIAKFKKIAGVDISKDGESLVGKTATVKVQAFNGNPWGDILKVA
jgi:hypothetical protein